MNKLILAAVKSAAAVFVLTNKNSPNPSEDDASTILRGNLNKI